MPSPDGEYAAMAFKLARVFNANKTALGIDKATAAHDDVASTLRVNLLRDTLEGLGQQRVIRVEKAPNISCGQTKAFVQRLGMSAVRFGDDVQMGIALQHVE